MPDVAMATASFGALHLIEEQELELDLGDGASHQLPHVSPSSGGTIETAHRSSLPHQHQRHFSGPPPPPYVYHHAGTALPRFIWNLYAICGSEQYGNYWFPLVPFPPLSSISSPPSLVPLALFVSLFVSIPPLFRPLLFHSTYCVACIDQILLLRVQIYYKDNCMYILFKASLYA